MTHQIVMQIDLNLEMNCSKKLKFGNYTIKFGHLFYIIPLNENESS